MLSDEHSTAGLYIFRDIVTMPGPNSNVATVEFYDAADERCRAIAMLHPSQQEATIKALADETGLMPHTLAPVIEKYVYQRVPDYPSLAKQFIERIGREKARTSLATNYGMRELTSAAQNYLTDQRLTVTGPRVSLFLDAIKAQFQPAPPSEFIVWGAPSRR